MKGNLWKALTAVVALAMILSALAACGPTPEPQVVEKVVKETVIVEGTPQVVEKVVTEVVEVEKVVTEVVEVEKVVTEIVEVEVEVTPEGEAKAVTMTFFEEPDTLNYQFTSMWFAGLAIDLLNPGLWYWDNNLEPSLEMAAEFPTKENGLISEDGLIVTIPINKEATWSDGEPVTANDFVFTYEMILDPNNTATQSTWPYDTYIASITAQDDKTLVVEFSDPFAPWATTIFQYVLPEHILRPVFEAEGSLDGADWNRNPEVVNGPFKLKAWESGSHLIFEANDSYWRGRPNLDQVNILVVPDDEAQMAAIKTGDTDVGIFLSYADIPTINELDDVDSVTVLSGYNESWFFNLNTDETAADNGHPAIQDVRVRQAIAYAVDFDAISQELLFGGTYPPGTVWEETPYAYPDANLYKYNPGEANRLLDEAGWVDSNGDGTRDKDGVELVLVYSTTQGREVREQTQVVAQQYLAEVGVGIEIRNNSYDTMWNSYGQDGPIATGGYDLAEWSTTGDFPDPNYADWLCSEIPSDDSPDGSNWYGICDEEMDALFQAQALEMDPVKRVELYHEIGKIMSEKVYWLGVWHDNDVWTVNRRTKGIKISGADPFWNAYGWDLY